MLDPIDGLREFVREVVWEELGRVMHWPPATLTAPTALENGAHRGTLARLLPPPPPAPAPAPAPAPVKAWQPEYYTTFVGHKYRVISTSRSGPTYSSSHEYINVRLRAVDDDAPRQTVTLRFFWNSKTVDWHWKNCFAAFLNKLDLVKINHTDQLVGRTCYLNLSRYQHSVQGLCVMADVLDIDLGYCE